jgi:hypothetical protein
MYGHDRMMYGFDRMMYGAGGTEVQHDKKIFAPPKPDSRPGKFVRFLQADSVVSGFLSKAAD